MNGGHHEEPGRSAFHQGLQTAENVIVGEASHVSRDALAEYAHEAWSGWMHYMFGLCITTEDGSLIIPAAKVGRWTRQMCQAYGQLPDGEKASDLAEADKMIKILFADE